MLLRHAKSDWENYHNDHGRGLTKRGIHAAQQMGIFLKQSKKLPDLVLCSTAVRAQKTLEIAATAGKWDRPIEYNKKLYATNPEQVLAIIQNLSDNYQSILLVGHEPTWSILSSMLIGGGRLDFPTGAMARMSFHVKSWQTISYGIGDLEWFIRPKLFTHFKS